MGADCGLWIKELVLGISEEQLLLLLLLLLLVLELSNASDVLMLVWRGYGGDWQADDKIF